MRRLKTKSFGERDVTIYLTESQWRGLLRRFDEEMIHDEDEHGLFRITVPCALCLIFAKKRGEDCMGCSLADVGCLHLVSKHGSEALSHATSSDKIEWYEDMNREVRTGIRNIRETLLNLPRIKKGHRKGRT